MSPCGRGHVAPTDATGHEGRPRSSRSVARQYNAATGAVVVGSRHGVQAVVGCEANKDTLTSDHRRRGFQACAVRLEPCQSCSSSVVGQGWRRPGSEHWRSCSRLRQWTWRDRRRAGELRGWVGICGCGSRRSWRGRKGRPARG
jgi:hypothetical protein